MTSSSAALGTPSKPRPTTLLNGESGSAKLAIPPAMGIRKPSVPVRAWVARLVSAMSPVSARSIRRASAVSQKRGERVAMVVPHLVVVDRVRGRGRGRVIGRFRARQEDQAGQDERCAEGLSRDEGLAEECDRGQRASQRLQRVEQARARCADRADPDVEREQGTQAAEQHRGRGGQLVGLGGGDPAPAGPPRAQHEGQDGEGRAEELPRGAADSLVGGLGRAARPHDVGRPAEHRREHQEVAERLRARDRG